MANEFNPVMDPVQVNTIDDCSICLRRTVVDNKAHGNLLLTGCGHLYHLNCISEWEEKGPAANRHNCPLCRHPLDYAILNLDDMVVEDFPLLIPDGVEIRQI